MSRHRKLNPIQMFIIKIKYRYALAKVGYKLSK